MPHKTKPPWCNSLNSLNQFAYVSELPPKPKLDHYYWVIGGNAHKFTKDGWQLINKVWLTAEYTIHWVINKHSYTPYNTP